MSPINFNYWMQGPLEMGFIKGFNKKQVSIIKEHINIVDSKNYFIAWLEGYLMDKDELNKEQVIIIKEKLQEEFTKITPFIDLTPTKPFQRGDEFPFLSKDVYC